MTNWDWGRSGIRSRTTFFRAPVRSKPDCATFSVKGGGVAGVVGRARLADVGSDTEAEDQGAVVAGDVVVEPLLVVVVAAVGARWGPPGSRRWSRAGVLRPESTRWPATRVHPAIHRRQRLGGMLNHYYRDAA